MCMCVLRASVCVCVCVQARVCVVHICTKTLTQLPNIVDMDLVPQKAALVLAETQTLSAVLPFISGMCIIFVMTLVNSLLANFSSDKDKMFH